MPRSRSAWRTRIWRQPLAEAGDRLAQGKTLAETLGVEPARIGALIGMATLALGRGEVSDAARLADEGLACSRAIGLGHDERKAERLMRLIAGRSGSRADASAPSAPPRPETAAGEGRYSFLPREQFRERGSAGAG